MYFTLWLSKYAGYMEWNTLFNKCCKGLPWNRIKESFETNYLKSKVSSSAKDTHLPAMDKKEESDPREPSEEQQ